MIPLYGSQRTRRFPWVTLLLILGNALVFLGWQIRVGLEESVDIGGLIPAEFPREPDSLIHLFAAMFMHGGWMHLLGNMWFLWIFGSNIEDATGARRFFYFYLICGAIAGLTQILASPHSLVPMIGASGAVSGVLGAYFLLFPRARIATAFFIFVFEIPAFVFLFFWIALQILSQKVAGHQEGGGVAYLAHIGGFFSGLLLIGLFRARLCSHGPTGRRD